MRTILRGLVGVTGAIAVSGLLPLQGAVAAAHDQPGQRVLTLSAGCHDAGSQQYHDWATTPANLQGGNDTGTHCGISVYTGYFNAAMDIQLTLSAASVAASGYTPQQLGQMLSVRSNFERVDTPSVVWQGRHWTAGPDGSLTLDIPDCNNRCRSNGETIDLDISGAPLSDTVALNGRLTLTDSANAMTTSEPVSLNYTGNGGHITLGTPGTFVPVPPARLLDTRYGTGAPKAKVGAGQSVGVQVTGQGGIPADGVTAVVLNVTATNPTAGSYVTAYPDGSTRPTASNLNFSAGQTIPNQVTVPVTNGKVDLYNRAGSVDLLADISGYYRAGDSGSRYTGIGPLRMLDTRDGTGAPQAKLGPTQMISLDVVNGSGVLPVLPGGVTAVVLNVTATNPTADSYVSVYPDGSTRPTVSNLNFSAGQTIPNQVTVPVTNGKVDLYNRAGSVDLVADLSGYYSANGSLFVPTGPTRVLDTRQGIGGYGTPFGPDKANQVVPNSWQYGVPPYAVTDVVLNVTATDATAGSYLSVFPAIPAPPRPNFSNLNFGAGQTIPNAVTSSLGDGTTAFVGGGVGVVNDGLDIYNRAGSVNVVADIGGYFTAG
ncbi:hypothetical protein GCM10009760_45990 [Kitasatospora kazusensis]|uniref:Uncharacterized protein n=1 Tax=Kitasatospora kazusensis TaxID=407974 RepID=A0ABP5LP02_9ACTN